MGTSGSVPMPGTAWHGGGKLGTVYLFPFVSILTLESLSLKNKYTVPELPDPLNSTLNSRQGRRARVLDAIVNKCKV